MEVNTMIQKVGVVGAGMMGAEIALCFTKAGYPTILNDIKMEFAEIRYSRVTYGRRRPMGR